MTELPAPGDVVVLKPFDNVPIHLFEVEDIYGELITGVALTGPLRGSCGAPDITQLEAILRF